MLNKILALAVVCVASFSSLQVQARGSSSGVMLTANAFMYNITAQDTPGSKSESKLSVYDVKLGYLMGNGFYLGGIYSTRNATNNSSEDGKAMGASAGYIGSGGFFLKGHYILSAERGIYKEGSGVQGDFGYLTNVTSSFMVGVELTYRSIDYKKSDNNSSLESHKQEELFPMLTVGFVF